MSEDRQSTLTIAPQNLGLLHPIGTPQVTPVHALAPGAQSLPSLMVAQPQSSLFPTGGGGQQYLSQGPTGPIPLSQVIDPSLTFMPGTGAHTAFQQNLQRAQDIALATGPGQFGAYHGTGASFNQFLDEFMGTGEGAQAFSWGHYVAGVKETGQTYQPPGGHLLNVWVKPEHEEFLDWDLPFNKQEPGVQEKLLNMEPTGDISKEENQMWLNGEMSGGVPPTGRRIYNSLVSDLTPNMLYDEARQAASKKLDEAGIPGMRFLDQQSRYLPATTLEYKGSALLPRAIGDRMQVRGNRLTNVDDLENDLINSRDMQIERGLEPWQEITRDPHRAGSGESAQTLYDAELRRLESGLDFIGNNRDSFVATPTSRTYNYVVYDPKNIEITHRDGIPLTPVDHDPFAP